MCIWRSQLARRFGSGCCRLIRRFVGCGVIVIGFLVVEDTVVVLGYF